MSDAPVLHVFAGKGGAGKTTLASARALLLADAAPKERILLISTSGDGSLADLWKKKLGKKPVRLLPGKGTAGLFGVAFDAASAFGPFAKEVQGALDEALAKGQVLSEDALRKAVSPVLDGLEELAGLFSLRQAIEEGQWDRVVLDTASTSHFLRLVDQTLLLRRLVKLLRPVAKGKKAVVEDALEAWAARGESLLELLRDEARTAVHVVALAEPVSEGQIRTFLAGLKDRQITPHALLVNLVEENEGCPACQGRRGLQAPHARKYKAIDKALPVVLLGRRETAPRGVEALRELGQAWEAGKESKALEFEAFEGPPALVRAPSMPPIAAPPLPPTRLIFFVGQGGTGKSSCAAAAAVTLTEREGPVLLISADPLHTLSDVLQCRLTDTETQVKGTKGLYARELDLPAWYASLKKRIKERAEKAFDQSKGAEVTADREVLRNLLDVAPAHIDELAGLCVLTDALFQERFKRIVVDLPPLADDTLRLVTLSKTGARWLEALQGVLEKYRAKGLDELADEVIRLRRSVDRFAEALASTNEARFVVVGRAEEGSVARTGRIVDALRELSLPVERVLINRILPKNDCPRCEGRRNAELSVAKAVEKKFDVPVTVAPALGRHPAGLRELKAFRTAWYALSAPTSKTRAA
ncbi:MAG TPA: ArsA family ATPase [Myxococcaceae bacterium]|nr:ArsA family ATPase [Myxococcaceae bacterium]